MAAEEPTAETPDWGRLTPSQLFSRCDTSGWRFETTAELEDLDRVIGQDRAVEAVQFALGMAQPGYNAYVLGPEGVDRHGIVRRFLDAAAAQRGAPPDQCYVHNFAEPHAPRALSLPAGRGQTFKHDMEGMVEDLRAALASAFESDEYRARRQVIEEEFKERQQQSLADIEEAAKAKGLALVRTPIGFAFAPVKDGKLVPPEAFGALPKEVQEQVQADIEELQKRLQGVLETTPLWLKESRAKLRELNHETASFAVGHLIGSLREAYEDLENVLAYLDELERDVVENVDAFLQPMAGGPNAKGTDGESPAAGLFRRYLVNLIVHNGKSGHAPVVHEDNPTFDRLMGRIEQRAELGTLVTDFNMIRPGALHRANGGYLMLDVLKLLTRPLSWEGLKRALLARQVRIEPLAQAMGLLTTTSLEPEPIGLDVKVVLIGDPMIYYLLSRHDPDFTDLFKVAADFDDRIERDDETGALFARQVATLVRKERLRPFGRAAVGRVLEQAARLADDRAKLSAKTELIADLLREADHWAGIAGRDLVQSEDVQKAIDKAVYRQDRLRQRLQEETVRGTILIDDRGARVGQVNGLSVISLGSFAFGRPSRITARIRLGRGDLVDIEREVELGGPLHSKGVLILKGFLSARYAPERPLSLSASLVFEQSYGGVDGDSASCAELCALLSALAEVPILQSFAVTGSVNQHGEVQAIGGVNEKIEGFFDLCAARGLTGDQGVVIPVSNVKHLMLRPDVVAAVEAGRFQVVAVATVDQAIETLTGQPAGVRDAEGLFAPGTINHKVEARLEDLSDKLRAFARRDESDKAT